MKTCFIHKPLCILHKIIVSVPPNNILSFLLEDGYASKDVNKIKYLCPEKCVCFVDFITSK